jgi:Fic family protein
MAKKAATFIRGLGSSSALTDRDWLTAIGSLLHDSTKEGRALAEKLLAKTKHGRQVRVLRLLTKGKPSIHEMQKAAKMSRRTIFRYLNSLEEYGVGFTIDDDFRYAVEKLPADLKRLL